MTTTTPRRWIGSADTAKLIRLALRDAFPGVKFSVRCAPGGSSIRVGWTDGPFTRDVDAVVKPYAGGRFDPMIDLAYNADHYLCSTHGVTFRHAYGHGAGYDTEPVQPCCGDAEQVQFLNNYVFTERTVSPERRAELEAQVAANFGEPFHPNSWPMREAYYDLLEGKRRP